MFQSFKNKPNNQEAGRAPKTKKNGTRPAIFICAKLCDGVPSPQ